MKGRYDVILDNVGNHRLRDLRRAVVPAGTIVLNAGGSPGHVFGPVAALARAVAVNAFAGQHIRPLPTRQDRAELAAITALIEEGTVTPVVDRTYPMADTAKGLHYVEAGHVHGKVVITIP
jgi:NADPH:quinone reductase-like Zn-dependent oxidoreductase